jgi:hypothetical protein
MGVEEIILIGGLGFAAYYVWTNSAIGQLSDTLLGGVEDGIKDAEGIFSTIEKGVVSFATSAADDLASIENIGVGTIPTCVSGGLLGFTCGICENKDNVDGLCYNRCPSGKNRVAGMPYLCSKRG